jgi:hypothetical protein
MDINAIVNWFKDNWVSVGVIYLAAIKLLQAIRDAIDKTPASDDNWFEKLVTILTKAAGQLFLGKRA